MLLPVIVITAITIATVASITGCTSVEEDFLKVSQGFELLNEQIQGDTLEWQEKFAPILADSSKYMFAGAYAYTTRSTQFLVNHLDNLIVTFDTLKPGDHQTATYMMIKQLIGRELENKIESYRKEVLAIPIWNEQDVAYLEDSIPLNTHYNQDNARKLGKKDWAAYHFDHVPSIAVITLLNKFKNDALRSQSMVWERIYDKAVAVEK